MRTHWKIRTSPTPLSLASPAMASPPRIHVVGASGAGTSTLGRALAERLRCAFVDTDDFYWLPSEPPFERTRAMPERLSLLEERLDACGDGWVLSGSLVSWGGALVPRFDAVIFLTLEPGARMARLRARERARYGTRVEPGGDLHAASTTFLEWAQAYEQEDFAGRSRTVHERWLGELPTRTRIVRLDSAAPVAELVDAVVTQLR